MMLLAAALAIDSVVSIGQWHALSRASGCAVFAAYRGPATPSLTVLVSNADPSQPGLVIAGTGWSIIDGASYPVTLEVDGGSFSGNATGQTEADGRAGLMLFLDPAVLDRIGRGASIRISVRDREVATLSLAGSAKAIAAFRSCADALPRTIAGRQEAAAAERRRAADPFSEIPPIVAPRSRDPNDWISAEDYPVSELNARAEGDVTYAFTINGNGRVENCRITKSSGNATLDATTCQLLTRRGNYIPGPTHGEGTYRWRLP